MRGRPITAEEFERMLAKTASIVEKSNSKSWKFFLRGLWWSGLRLTEATSLHWTDDTNLTVDLSGPYPMFLIRSAADKGNKDRAFPMAPEFAELLKKIPEAQREGYVFNPTLTGVATRPDPKYVAESFPGLERRQR